MFFINSTQPPCRQRTLHQRMCGTNLKGCAIHVTAKANIWAFGVGFRTVPICALCHHALCAHTLTARKKEITQLKFAFNEISSRLITLSFSFLFFVLLPIFVRLGLSLFLFYFLFHFLFQTNKQSFSPSFFPWIGVLCASYSFKIYHFLSFYHSLSFALLPPICLFLSFYHFLFLALFLSFYLLLFLALFLFFSLWFSKLVVFVMGVEYSVSGNKPSD